MQATLQRYNLFSRVLTFCQLFSPVLTCWRPKVGSFDFCRSSLGSGVTFRDRAWPNKIVFTHKGQNLHACTYIYIHLNIYIYTYICIHMYTSLRRIFMLGLQRLSRIIGLSVETILSCSKGFMYKGQLLWGVPLCVVFTGLACIFRSHASPLCTKHKGQYMYMRVYIYVCIYIYILYIYMYIYKYKHTYKYIHTYECVYIYMYIYICIYVCGNG